MIIDNAKAFSCPMKALLSLRNKMYYILFKSLRNVTFNSINKVQSGGNGPHNCTKNSVKLLSVLGYLY